MLLPWLLLLACETADTPNTISEPENMNQSLLPSSVIDLNMAEGEMLRFGTVQGYRARRRDYTGDLAIVMWADPFEESVQSQARERAEQPALVFVVAPLQNMDATLSYIEGLPGITRIEHVGLEARNP